MKRLKPWQKGLIAALVALAILAAAFFIYVGDYYHADKSAIAAYKVTAENVDSADIGFIFYPGGKVESRAYLPLIADIQAKGYSALLVDMPFNLAFFGMNKADAIIEAHPEVAHWYIGGHSLGGVAASSYASGNDRLEGVILLASYSTADLSRKRVLTIYGTEDGVLNMKAYAENKNNLPLTYKEEIIEGGCHAGFGMYGAQSGDGTPTISGAEQVKLTASLISDFLRGSYQ